MVPKTIKSHSNEYEIIKNKKPKKPAQEPIKKGRQGRTKDPLTGLKNEALKKQRAKEREENKRQKAIQREIRKEMNKKAHAAEVARRRDERHQDTLKRRAERKEYEDWWKSNTKSNKQIERDIAKDARKEAIKREQAARKAEIKEFRTFVKDLKNKMKEWATKSNLSQDALEAVLKQIPGVELTAKGNISAAKSDRRNDEMKQALQNMLKDKKSFANALKNSAFWDTDRKRQLWYRIFVDTFDKEKLSPLKWGSLGYQDIVEKWDELEIAVIQNDLVLANQLMDELDKLMDEAQRKIDAGNVTEDYNYDDDYANF